ncbi:hypothetical protein Tco_1280092 [Tanacetum coccineum]
MVIVDHQQPVTPFGCRFAEEYQFATDAKSHKCTVLLHDPVDGDEEGTGVQTDALIKEIQRSGAQTQFHPTRQSMNEVDLLDDGY